MMKLAFDASKVKPRRIASKMKLAYDVYTPSGGGEGKSLPPIIMLHALIDSRKTWKHVAPLIANRTGRKVYAIDSRNHGDSPLNKEMSWDINAEDLCYFMKDHNIPKAVIVGHSMGGRTAMKLALTKPECVETIIVEEMGPTDFTKEQNAFQSNITAKVREFLNQLPQEADEEAVLSYINSIISKAIKGGGISLSKNSNNASRSVPLQKESAVDRWKAKCDIFYDMYRDNKTQQNLKGVYAKDALFLYGSKSIFPVKEDPLMPKLFPRAIYSCFDGAKHVLHESFPERFVDEVSSFINGRYTRSKY